MCNFHSTRVYVIFKQNNFSVFFNMKAIVMIALILLQGMEQILVHHLRSLIKIWRNIPYIDSVP